MTIRSEMTTCSEKGEMWPRTDLLDLLGIRHPILQAPMSTYDGPQLVAAVSNAGALGSQHTRDEMYRAGRGWAAEWTPANLDKSVRWVEEK
jgi:NAD(P)H-dependent flavin oxidoreductase YrpB (nitropropane dioxygenase family)